MLDQKQHGNPCTIAILFDDVDKEVVPLFRGTAEEAKTLLSTNYPNVVLVYSWEYVYELDCIALFNQRSDTEYTENCAEP